MSAQKYGKWVDMDNLNLFTEYEAFIKACAKSTARDATEADELWQKANIILWRQNFRLSKMKPAEVRSFLARSIKNALIDIRRKERHTVSLEYDMPQEGNFENAIVDKMTIMLVIGCLTDVEQDIIFKSFHLGMDSTEIARQLKIPSTTVRSKKARALQKLKKALKERL